MNRQTGQSDNPTLNHNPQIQKKNFMDNPSAEVLGTLGTVQDMKTQPDNHVLNNPYSQEGENEQKKMRRGKKS